MRSLQEYRETVEKIGAGTVSTDFVREILDAAEAEVEARAGEFTVTQAVELSGRSRSWYERRLRSLEADGLARKAGTVWLLKAAAIPPRPQGEQGFDPRLSPDQVADQLVA